MSVLMMELGSCLRNSAGHLIRAVLYGIVVLVESNIRFDKVFPEVSVQNFVHAQVQIGHEIVNMHS